MGLFSRRRSSRPITARDERASSTPGQEALGLVDRGNALEQDGRSAEALEFYDAAIRLAPEIARAHRNRGNALLDLARTTEALAAYSAAIARDPDFASAYYNMGNAHLRLGQNEAALSAYRKALALKPDFVDAEVGVGCALEEVGQRLEAVACYRRALAIRPAYAEVHGNLGHALRALGQVDEAVASFRRALAIDSEYALARRGLAGALADLGQLDEAILNYVELLRGNPDDVDSLINLGNAQIIFGRTQDAVASYRRALELKPDLAGVHTGLGNALTFLGRHSEAVACHHMALKISPELAEAHSNLGNTLYNLGQLDDAAKSYRRAQQIKPDYAQAYTGLLFSLCHDETVGPERLFAEHCRFGMQFEAPQGTDRPRHENVPDPDRRLRIGFVSADLRDHPIAFFIEPLLARLAGSPHLSLHAYYNYATEDAVTPRLRRHFKEWSAIVTISDAALADRIRNDRIDILIDLSGHTAGNRLLTFARKPTPVQASWMGYPGSTGLRAMDYYFADPCFLPMREFAGQFTEKLVHLPASAPFLPFEGAPDVNMLPALTNGYVTFGSFNRISKLRPAVIALWSRLLRAMPNSRMVLGGMPSEGLYAQIVDSFAREGIDGARLRFYPRCGTRAYLALHQRVDICLDAFPYAGGTTTAHALWMGVPTLSLAGQTVPARQGASILGHVGLDAFVAHNPTEFQRRGLAHAGDLRELARTRIGLRDRCERSAMQRPELIAAGLEYALRAMWQRWCSGLPAEAIDATLADTGKAN